MFRTSCLLFTIFTFLACSSDESGLALTCPPNQSVSNPAGHIHGVPCTPETASECMYGICDISPFNTDGRIGICTKSCAACENSDCASENMDGMSFTCLRVSNYGERCVPKCTSLADCQRISPQYTHCTNNPPWSEFGSIGVYKFCVIDPTLPSSGNSSAEVQEGEGE